MPIKFNIPYQRNVFNCVRLNYKCFDRCVNKLIIILQVILTAYDIRKKKTTKNGYNERENQFFNTVETSLVEKFTNTQKWMKLWNTSNLHTTKNYFILNG